ncbi:MAG: sulfur carrier protein ThiS [Candidatus Nanopelagicales bacterium]
MQITINGRPRALDHALNVTELLSQLGYPDRGVAVAVDGVVVAKASWPSTIVTDSREIEIVTAVQGG